MSTTLEDMDKLLAILRGIRFDMKEKAQEAFRLAVKLNMISEVDHSINFDIVMHQIGNISMENKLLVGMFLMGASSHD